ncbi:MAG: hypothetical protein HYW78_01225 [Parcubacteria group bacterium]|nr:hypothetical protein [Parcubacteria group bacterium]
MSYGSYTDDKRKKNREETAYILSTIFDRGGWSTCSECAERLDNLMIERLIENISGIKQEDLEDKYKFCPNCGRKLVEGKITYIPQYNASKNNQVDKANEKKKADSATAQPSQEKTEKIAYIVDVVSDQGTGGSWCSECENNLTRYIADMDEEIPDRCPWCDSTLKLF